MTELEKKAQALELKLKEATDFVEKNKDLNVVELKETIADLQKKLSEIPEQTEVKADADFIEMNTVVNRLNADIKALKAGKTEEYKSFGSEIERILKAPETKAAFDKGEMKGAQGKTFEMKVDTTAFTGVVTTSQVKPGAAYSRENLLTVTPLFSVVPMDQDKSRIVWVEGAYTSNVGYAGEGVGATTADTGTEQEYSRELAKISAKMPFSAEMFEDRSAFAARLQSKLLFNSEKFINTNLINGDGLDGDAIRKKHIYGLIASGSIAFDAGDLALSIAVPSIDDLATAIDVQADEYTPTHVLINKSTLAKYSRVKDTTGQLVIREVNGELMLAGMTVVKSAVMANDALLAVDPMSLELWVKRGMEFKIGQEGTNLSDDSYTAVAFWRGQAVVESVNKAGNIYVADIDAALTALKSI